MDREDSSLRNVARGIAYLTSLEKMKRYLFMFFIVLVIFEAQYAFGSLLKMGIFDTSHFELYANDGPLQIRIAIAMMVISGLGVALRFYARRLVGQQYLWDDWMVLMAVPFAWGINIMEILAVKYGNLGRHVQLATTDPSKVQFFFKALYIIQIFYVVSLALTKFSITFLYRRIFQVKNTNLALGALDGFLGLRFIALIIVVVCPCLPIYTFWTKEDRGACVNSSSFLLAAAATNIASDLLILVFPIPIIWTLQMSRAQKIAILAYFSLGSFIVIVSCLRLVAIAQQKGHEDVTWAYLPLAVWTTMEANIAIFCACIPSMRPLVRNLQNINPTTTGAGTAHSYSRVRKCLWFRSVVASSENHANLEILDESLELGNANRPRMAPVGGNRDDDFEMPKQGTRVERDISLA